MFNWRNYMYHSTEILCIGVLCVRATSVSWWVLGADAAALGQTGEGLPNKEHQVWHIQDPWHLRLHQVWPAAQPPHAAVWTRWGALQVCKIPRRRCHSPGRMEALSKLEILISNIPNSFCGLLFIPPLQLFPTGVWNDTPGKDGHQSGHLHASLEEDSSRPPA